MTINRMPYLFSMKARCNWNIILWGISEKTQTQTASMHKTVLAILIGIAIDRGYIKEVNEKAFNYISEWSDDDRNKITIKQMLQQSSGIDYPSFSINPLTEWNPNGGWRPYRRSDAQSPAKKEA
ncbi:MAG: hypothetical protein Ct9H300mP4_10990 [Gammaproteobacteria bacterium]|nr:MAG: hypothetical protein Ct9H300mP4_10990 [Gammaproteobacteria bacterium]